MILNARETRRKDEGIRNSIKIARGEKKNGETQEVEKGKGKRGRGKGEGVRAGGIRSK